MMATSSALPAGVDQAQRAAVLAALVDVGQRLESNNHAANTKKAYARDFTHFADWCATVPLPALPAAPETVYLYLSALVANDNAAGYAVSTLDRRLAAIGWRYESSSHDNPCRHARIRQLMSGIRRTHGNPPLKRDPLSTEQLGAMLEALDLTTLTGKRDRALLLVGYAGAFRRSELVGLTVEQLARRGDRGYVVRLVRTKDDQQRRGRDVGIPRFAGSTLCPVAALDTWLTAAEITSTLLAAYHHWLGCDPETVVDDG